MTKRTLTKQARTLVDKFGNVSIAAPQERARITVNIKMPNGSIKKVIVLMSPGQLINQRKLRKRIIAGDYRGVIVEE